MMSCVGAEMQMGLLTACELSHLRKRESILSFAVLECIGTEKNVCIHGKKTESAVLDCSC